MKRRELLQKSAALGFLAAMPFSPSGEPQTDAELSADVTNPLKPPADGSIPVAFLISDGAVVIDFAGPWEVFGNVMIHGRMDIFHLYTVAETLKPIRASGGASCSSDVRKSRTRRGGPSISMNTPAASLPTWPASPSLVASE